MCIRDSTGAMIRSLQEMVSHSVLSGPKTPMRALLGTGTATFLRPLSTFMGALIRYPFEGDSATIRASLASMNGMMEAVPEAFDLFFTKLNGYWSGELSTIRTRYIEFSKGDYNWELIRRWAEDSGRADKTDRAIFAFTNMVRSINNNNMFSYSTKIMAATDDAFTFLLGRAKMREKAMRQVLDMQGTGINLPEITPTLMRAYQDDFYGQIFDSAGNIKDEATNFARKEVTLTQDLTGFAKGLYVSHEGQYFIVIHQTRGQDHWCQRSLGHLGHRFHDGLNKISFIPNHLLDRAIISNMHLALFAPKISNERRGFDRQAGRCWDGGINQMTAITGLG